MIRDRLEWVYDLFKEIQSSECICQGQQHITSFSADHLACSVHLYWRVLLLKCNSKLRFTFWCCFNNFTEKVIWLRCVKIFEKCVRINFLGIGLCCKGFIISSLIVYCSLFLSSNWCIFSGCSYPDPRGEGPPPPPRSYDDDYSANGYYDSYKEPPPPAPPQESLGSGSYYDRFYKKPPPSQQPSRPPPPPGTNQAEPLYFWIWKKIHITTYQNALLIISLFL